MTRNATTLPATLTVAEAAALLGISRGAAYTAARSGELAGVPVIRVGAKRLVIPRAPFEALLGITTPATTGSPTDNEDIEELS